MIEQLETAQREVWSRRSVSRAHIDTSVYLVLQGAPSCSANLLAAAALDVLRGVLRVAGKSSAVDEILQAVPADLQKEAIKLFKSPYNYAKHADRDPDEDFDIFSSFCQWTLFAASYDYKTAYQQWTPRMLIFAWWFAATHKSWLESFEVYRSTPKSGLFAADQSPEYALRIIDHVEQNPQVISNILNDLGLDWIET